MLKYGIIIIIIINIIGCTTFKTVNNHIVKIESYDLIQSKSTCTNKFIPHKIPHKTSSNKNKLISSIFQSISSYQSIYLLLPIIVPQRRHQHFLPPRRQRLETRTADDFDQQPPRREAQAQAHSRQEIPERLLLHVLHARVGRVPIGAAEAAHSAHAAHGHDDPTEAR